MQASNHFLQYTSVINREDKRMWLLTLVLVKM